MSSTPRKPDLTPLADVYEIVGELGGRDHTISYVGRRKEDGRDVLVTVMHAEADVAEGKAIAQFAADAKLLTTLSHPNVPQVLEGRWIGDDAFALVSERVHGTTLSEMLAGDRMPNPRIADILSDVDGVLEWARGERIVHRGVTPDDVTVERGSGKIFVQLSPTEAPKTNRPDPRDDARTIGRLALMMLMAKPIVDDHDGKLATMRPDLPQRVADATEKLAAVTINDEQPNVSSFLASVAMADAIKEGELEVARLDAEFRAAMKAEREKWEAEQHACELANQEQAKKFAEERAEYDRRAAKEREQLAAARAEIDKRRTELQQARTELDQARNEFKQKKGELEARVKEIDRHAKDLEKQKRDLEKHARDVEQRRIELEAKNRDLTAAAAAAAATAAASPETSVDSLKQRLSQPLVRADEMKRPTVPVDVVREFNRPTVPVEQIAADEVDEPELDDAEVADTADAGEPAIAGLAAGVESEDTVHQPWTPIEAAEPWSVPLEADEPVDAITYEAAAVPNPDKKSARPAWAVPAGVAGFLVLLVGTAVALNHRHEGATVTPLVASATTPTQAPASAVPLPGIVTDSAAGVVASASPSDSDEFTTIRDSIVAADARREARQARQASEGNAGGDRPAPHTITDANGVKWTTVPPPPLDSVKRQMAAQAAAASNPPTPRIDSLPKPAARSDSGGKKDSAKAKPDTVVKPDTGTTRKNRTTH